MRSYAILVKNTTCQRIEWWTNGPQMVQAAHTVIACFAMTVAQRRIIGVFMK
jgi:hypothetical protein